MQLAVQSPSQVNVQSPVPWHCSTPRIPTREMQPEVPGQMTVHASPHVRSQLALPLHWRVAPVVSPPTMHALPPLHVHVLVAVSQLQALEGSHIVTTGALVPLLQPTMQARQRPSAVGNESRISLDPTRVAGA